MTSTLTALVVAGLLATAPGDRIDSWKNPIIPGFHPDPSVARVGEDYYLVTSSFEFFPGVPIYHSRDLVHWEQIGHVLTRASQLPLEGVGPSRGIFAPTLRHHDGVFYMITTNVSGGGNFYVKATDPAGPWSEPTYIPGQGGIDPSLFFEDGKVYLQSTGGAPGVDGVSGVYQSTIDLNTGELTSEPKLIWRGTGGRYPEGPHLYRVGEFYYLMISEGGTEYGHMVTIARSHSPWGPFEPCPRNPILTNRNTQLDQHVQGTGHADLVQDHEGNWRVVFLAYRVGNWYWYHLGRETFLAPVTWDDAGWPVVNDGKPATLEMTASGLPVHTFEAPAVRTDFDTALGLEWNYLRNPDTAAYSLEDRVGWLRLMGRATAMDAEASPTFVGRRQQHLSARLRTRVDFEPMGDNEEAGVVVYRHPDHRYELGVRRSGEGREVFLRQTVGSLLSVTTDHAIVDHEGPIVLSLEATPEEYHFSFGTTEDDLQPLGAALTRLVSTEVASGFIGVYLGLYATGNGKPAESPAYFDWFDYEPLGD
jgi:alpha-N-arabinofuranosidase